MSERLDWYGQNLRKPACFRAASRIAAVCLLLTQCGMRFSALNLLAGLMIVAAVAVRTAAQDALPPATQIRPDQSLRPLVEEAASRSATIRELIDQLEHLDVTVYIRINALLPTDLDGRVAILPTGSRQRYLVIEL